VYGNDKVNKMGQRAKLHSTFLLTTLATMGKYNVRVIMPTNVIMPIP
jgi:hypothetical protein